MLLEGATRCLPCNVTIPGIEVMASISGNTFANHLQANLFGESLLGVNSVDCKPPCVPLYVSSGLHTALNG